MMPLAETGNALTRLSKLAANDKSRYRQAFILAVIIVLTFASYFGVLLSDFISYDDYKYVTDNAHVRGGLSLDGILWAFTTTHCSHWHPLTWISHMADVQIFGMNPGGHHLINLIFHLFNIALVFIFICELTPDTWTAGVVAAFFAIHPMNVESVAWIAERKNVLSTFFYFSALIAYTRYVKSASVWKYAPIIPLTAAALMSKAMAVTIPLTMLLMDYWPFRRLDKRAALIEKIPVIVLCAAASAAIFIVQKQAGTVLSINELSVSMRILAALSSYVDYMVKLFLPLNLSIHYPFTGILPPAATAVKASVFILITAAALWQSPKRPYIAFGWFWYVITLLPVIQVVRMITADMADRYVYVPYVGLFLIIGGMSAELCGRAWKTAMVLALAAAIITLSLCTKREVGFWRDSATLYERALAVTPHNYVINNNYGQVLMRKGRLREAIAQFTEGLSIKPDNRELNFNLLTALALSGKSDELERRIASIAEKSRVYREIALAAMRYRRYDIAAEFFSKTLQAGGEAPDVYDALAMSLGALGRYGEALENIRKGLAAAPENPALRLHEQFFHSMMPQPVK